MPLLSDPHLVRHLLTAEEDEMLKGVREAVVVVGLGGQAQVTEGDKWSDQDEPILETTLLPVDDGSVHLCHGQPHPRPVRPVDGHGRRGGAQGPRRHRHRGEERKLGNPQYSF